MPPVQASKIRINGVVQGVGFRPFIFGLAHDHDLVGEVANTPRGVVIHAQGRAEKLKAFVQDIHSQTPPLARITGCEVTDTPLRELAEFTIIQSRAVGSRATLISPDVSICEDCRAELLDPSDRRYHYPFINCTNCGPRFTIIRDLPYDRPKTAMAEFPMCEDCLAEYQDPRNRRFHAQPNACPVCGPQVFLCDPQGERLDENPAQALDLAARVLAEGKILAIKGLGGFHLACDAGNAEAVVRLRQRKQRPHKPLALMVRSLDTIRDLVEISPEEETLLTSLHKPIVLLKKKARAKIDLPKELAPGNSCLGAMLPYTPLHLLLLEQGPELLVMTSGNRPGQPLSTDNDDALDAFGHIADLFLLHNREIHFGTDDAIARIQDGETRFIRRSRGYAPMPLLLEDEMPPVLACGGGLKNTLCLTRGNQAFLSQHIGDMEDPKVHTYFDRTAGHMENLLEIQPEIVAHDLHPDFYPTQYARSRAAGDSSLSLVGVQHHHAHAVACMAENNLLDGEPVLAVTLDGTGLGPDGKIWGGEILTCTATDFQRRAHLAWMPLPGGDAAARQPWRMAASLLYLTHGRDFPDLDLNWLVGQNSSKLAFLVQMMDRGLNSPLTSSCGRRFDGIASLLGLCQEMSHEGQAAMVLEEQAQGFLDARPPRPVPRFPVEIRERGAEHPWEINPLELDFVPLVQGLLSALAEEEPEIPTLAAGFHFSLVDALARTVSTLSQTTGLDRVVLSGGVFYNDIMLTGLTRELTAAGLKVFTHTQLPPGDGGISLGQAVVAAARVREQDKGEVHVP